MTQHASEAENKCLPGFHRVHVSNTLLFETRAFILRINKARENNRSYPNSNDIGLNPTIGFKTAIWSGP